MLASDMNDQPLPFGHGAPLRLRNEIELGFKEVKWIKGIEFVAHYSEVGGGYGGYNQDHEFSGYRHHLRAIHALARGRQVDEHRHAATSTTVRGLEQPSRSGAYYCPRSN
jgi:DMSO/TMAO reductase YedYZ molybdopterin-dependent catalytic subunit